MTGVRLSIDRIARRWAAEAEQAASQPSDIAGDLVAAALRGEFEFGIRPITKPTSVIADDSLNDALGEDFEFGVTPLFKYNPPPPPELAEDPEPLEGAPGNYDARLGVMVEVFNRDGDPVNAGQLQAYLKTRKSAPGGREEEALRFMARDIYLSVEGFRRWCDRPEFDKWARLMGLSQPLFIDEQGDTLPPGSYDDRTLVEEIRKLVTTGRANSVNKAAKLVAQCAEGKSVV